MINLQYIAEAYNKLLGTNDYIVYLDTNYTPQENDTERTLCVMTVSRNPQALGGAIDSETLTLTISFDIKISDRANAIKRKVGINAVLGWQSFQVTTPEGETYNVDSWLDLTPAEPARVDEGALMQIISASGTALVSNASVGAIVSNRIRTYINGEQLTVMSYNGSLMKGTDEFTDLSDDGYQIEPQEITRTNSATITALYTGSDIDKHFRNVIENGTDDGEIMNKVYKVERWFPDEGGTVIERSMKLIGATSFEQAGAYAYYQLQFRKVDASNIKTGVSALSIEADGAELIAIGANETYTATVTYYGSSEDNNVSWDTSSLPPICTAKKNRDGSITIYNNSPTSGASLCTTTVTITAYSNNDTSIKASISFTITYYKVVSSVAITAITTKTFNGSYVYIDKTVQLIATVTYNDNSTNNNVTWSITTEDSGITISGGYVTNASESESGDDIDVTVKAVPNDAPSMYTTYKLTCQGGLPVYTITYQDGSHSTASGPTSAHEGELVTVTADADENYAITDISVWKDEDGSTGSRYVTSGGDYEELTFTMPAYNVIVTTSDQDY